MGVLKRLGKQKINVLLILVGKQLDLFFQIEFDFKSSSSSLPPMAPISKSIWTSATESVLVGSSSFLTSPFVIKVLAFLSLNVEEL